MYLYYNNDGVLKEFINDKQARQSNSNVNKIYCYYEGINTDITMMTVKFKYDDGTSSSVYPCTTKTTLSLDYDKSRDLKYFMYFKDYKFFVFNIPDEVLVKGRSMECSLALENSEQEVIQGLEKFTFFVADNLVTEDDLITMSQYNMLLLAIAKSMPRTDIKDKVLKSTNNENETVWDFVSNGESILTCSKVFTTDSQPNINDDFACQRDDFNRAEISVGEKFISIITETSSPKQTYYTLFEVETVVGANLTVKIKQFINVGQIISATNKLSSDFVSDTNNTNKFVTDTEKEAWNNKVDPVTGKGLSTNDYTNTDKGKVDTIKTDGNGDKYLTDDGTYKEIRGGGVNLITVDEFREMF